MKAAKRQQLHIHPVLQDADTQASGSNEDEEMEPYFNQIEKLEEHGINSADIGKLKSAGLCTVLSVLMWYFFPV